MKIVQATGQTCNQFWIYSNFIADAIEKNEKFAIWVPDISLKDFSNLKNSSYISYPLYSTLLIKIFGYEKYINFLSSLFLNKYALFLLKSIVKLIPFTKVDVVGTETNIKNINRQKHIEQLKEIFSPNIESISEVESLFKQVRENYDVVIGIHIRYGDYRSFSNGKYYFELEDYNLFLKKVEALFIDKKLTFFIASNEALDLKCFSDLSHFTNIIGTPTNDLIGLSMCDYICGPPSTFSAWASLYNHVPLYFIENIKEPITKNSFIHIEDIWL